MRLTQNSQFLLGRYKMYFTDGYCGVGDEIATVNRSGKFKFKIIDGPIKVGIEYQYLLEGVDFDTIPFIGGNVYEHTSRFEESDLFYGHPCGSLEDKFNKLRIETTNFRLQRSLQNQLKRVEVDAAKFKHGGIAYSLDYEDRPVKVIKPILEPEWTEADLVPSDIEKSAETKPKSILHRIKRLLF